MSLGTRSMLVLLLLSAASLPPVTAHAQLPAVAAHEHESAAFSLHPEMLPIAVLSLLSWCGIGP